MNHTLDLNIVKLVRSLPLQLNEFLGCFGYFDAHYFYFFNSLLSGIITGSSILFGAQSQGTATIPSSACILVLRGLLRSAFAVYCAFPARQLA
eukprot:scaffold83151_cov15-Tisochrysis_lutea.AAC.1